MVSGLVILVGHSPGALNMQAYADTYPENVKGLVLIDPPPQNGCKGKGFRSFVNTLLMSRRLVGHTTVMKSAGVSTAVTWAL